MRFLKFFVLCLVVLFQMLLLCPNVSYAFTDTVAVQGCLDVSPIMTCLNSVTYNYTYNSSHKNIKNIRIDKVTACSYGTTLCTDYYPNTSEGVFSAQGIVDETNIKITITMIKNDASIFYTLKSITLSYDADFQTSAPTSDKCETTSDVKTCRKEQYERYANNISTEYWLYNMRDILWSYAEGVIEAYRTPEGLIQTGINEVFGIFVGDYAYMVDITEAIVTLKASIHSSAMVDILSNCGALLYSPSYNVPDTLRNVPYLLEQGREGIESAIIKIGSAQVLLNGTKSLLKFGCSTAVAPAAKETLSGILDKTIHFLTAELQFWQYYLNADVPPTISNISIAEGSTQWGQIPINPTIQAAAGKTITAKDITVYYKGKPGTTFVETSRSDFFTWDSTTSYYGDGPYSVDIWAVDSAGRTVEEVRHFTVDNTPKISILSATTDQTAYRPNTNAKVSFTLQDSHSSSVSAATVNCYLYDYNNQRSPVATLNCTNTSGGNYEANFTTPNSSLGCSGIEKYLIKISAKKSGYDDADVANVTFNVTAAHDIALADIDFHPTDSAIRPYAGDFNIQPGLNIVPSWGLIKNTGDCPEQNIPITMEILNTSKTVTQTYTALMNPNTQSNWYPTNFSLNTTGLSAGSYTLRISTGLSTDTDASNNKKEFNFLVYDSSSVLMPVEIPLGTYNLYNNNDTTVAKPFGESYTYQVESYTITLSYNTSTTLVLTINGSYKGIIHSSSVSGYDGYYSFDNGSLFIYLNAIYQFNNPPQTYKPNVYFGIRANNVLLSNYVRDVFRTSDNCPNLYSNPNYPSKYIAAFDYVNYSNCQSGPVFLHKYYPHDNANDDNGNIVNNMVSKFAVRGGDSSSGSVCGGNESSYGGSGYTSCSSDTLCPIGEMKYDHYIIIPAFSPFNPSCTTSTPYYCMPSGEQNFLLIQEVNCGSTDNPLFKGYAHSIKLFVHDSHDVQIMPITKPTSPRADTVHPITVSIKNNGDVFENVNVTLKITNSYGYNWVSSQSVSNLSPGISNFPAGSVQNPHNITFNWDATGLQGTDYTITASAEISGDSNLIDNSTSTVLTLAPPPALNFSSISAQTSYTQEQIATATVQLKDESNNLISGALVSYFMKSWTTAAIVSSGLLNDDGGGNYSLSNIKMPTTPVTYTFQFRGSKKGYLDTNDNTSSNQISIIVNDLPPTVSITGNSPYDNKLINKNSVTFYWTGNDITTPTNSLKYSYKIDSGSWSAAVSNTSNTFSEFSDGEHTFYIKAIDENIGNENNESDVISRTFIIDTVAPDFDTTPSANASVYSNGSIITITTDLNDTAAMVMADFSSIDSNFSGGGVYTTNINDTNHIYSTTYTLSSNNTKGDGLYTIPVTINDVAGNYRINYALSVRLENKSPTVTDITPANNSANVSATSTLLISFSEDMDKTSAESAFSISPTAAGTFQWQGNNLLQFTPTGNLVYGTTYTVSVASGAKDTAGKLLTATSSTFMVVQNNLLSISIVPASLGGSILPGTTQQFAATCHYDVIGEQNCTSGVTWTPSSNMNNSGLFTVNAPGTSTVKASIGTLNSNSVNLTVACGTGQIWFNNACCTSSNEVCDGADNNCNGTVDENVCSYTYYCDNDNDGYNNPTSSGSCSSYNCVPYGCNTAAGNDCNDSDPSVGYSKTETQVCTASGNCPGNQTKTCNNGVWGNWSACSSSTPCACVPNDTQTQGCGNCSKGTQTRACGSNGQWGEWSACSGGGTCYTGQTQTCTLNSITGTKNCSNLCEWGECVVSCGIGQVLVNNSCCTVSTEICDNVDNDCNGVVDNGGVCNFTYYCDNDNDGYKSSTSSGACSSYNCVPSGCSIVQGNDCNNSNPAVNPGATEICDGIDNNCNNTPDDGSGICPFYIYYCDSDNDGYKSLVSSGSCSTVNCIPSGCSAAQGNDCNDSNPAIKPNADDTCDNIDNDCDGSDEGCSYTYYCDSDRDGYKNSVSSGSCSSYNCLPSECSAAQGSDCNDSNPAIKPSALEICDGADNDCNNRIDDGGICAYIYYCDSDGDGYKSKEVSGSCSSFNCMPSGCTTLQGNDCNDSNPSIKTECTVSAGNVTISIPKDISGYSPSSYTSVPIKIDNLSPNTAKIGSISVTLTYDSTKTMPIGASSIGVCSAALIMSNIDPSGKITIGLIGTNINQIGECISVVFSIVSGLSANTVIPVTFSSYSVGNMDGDGLNVTATSGSIKIGDSGGCMKGDVKANGAIDVNDALMALKIAVGIISSPTVAQICAADVHPRGAPDGQITVNDALMILKYAVGIISSF